MLPEPGRQASRLAHPPQRATMMRMHTAYIGMGANLPSHAGSPEATLARAAVQLESLGQVRHRSSLYSTEPIGFAQQPHFLNTVVALETDHSPRALLDALQAIEVLFGRDRSDGVDNGPRTLDLDILLFDDLIVHEPGLEIPHPRLAERAFVLVPLSEVAPHAIDPQTQKSIGLLLRDLHSSAMSHGGAVVPIHGRFWRAGR